MKDFTKPMGEEDNSWITTVIARFRNRLIIKKSKKKNTEPEVDEETMRRIVARIKEYERNSYSGENTIRGDISALPDSLRYIKLRY